jgi:electron transport complex protein RnfB
MEPMNAAPIHDLAARIDAVLPQMQCRRCGYDGCRPYAEAIAQGDAINRCPPGGDALIAMLAALVSRPVIALDPAHGRHEPLRNARIDEARCIGCTLCIQACPVDAIIGAARQMHSVISRYAPDANCASRPARRLHRSAGAGRAWSAEDARAHERATMFMPRASHEVTATGSNA